MKRSLIGLGIGAAAGVAFGANLGSRRHGLSAAAFGGILGGIGAAAGASIPIGNPLYEAPGGLKKPGPQGAAGSLPVPVRAGSASAHFGMSNFGDASIRSSGDRSGCGSHSGQKP